MNRKTKILLSVMIVSLSAFIFTLDGHGEHKENDHITVQQNTMEFKDSDIKYAKEEVVLSLNFQIDKAIEEANQKIEEINSINNMQEWFIDYKNIIDEYSYIIDPPETIYDYFTDEELDLLFGVVQAEIGDEYSFDQKVNVANVIFNRWYHEQFPDTLLEILTPDQFSTISNGNYKKVKVSEATILACEYAFIFEDTTDDCLFFDSNGVHKYKYIFNDGAHNFYRLEN